MFKKIIPLLIIAILLTTSLTACFGTTTTPEPETPAKESPAKEEPSPQVKPAPAPAPEPEIKPGQDEPSSKPEPKTEPEKTAPKPEPEAVQKPDPAEGERNETPREDVWMLPFLNYELTNLIGQKIWTIGFYGDATNSGDGLGFLVLNYQSLLVGEVLEHNTFARLQGDLPGMDLRSAEILVYGEVHDYATAMDDPSSPPVPLITVEKYEIISQPKNSDSWENPFEKVTAFFRSFFSAPVAFAQEAVAGNQATPCDRALIISGGIDAHNNHARYKDNVLLKYKTLRKLGFTPGHIDVIYADGAAINIGVTNIVDKSATKANIKAAIEKYLKEMDPSCTLTIFITDHGTGYSDKQGWSGARPAESGVDSNSGKLYAENTFKIDLKKKVWQRSTNFNTNGKVFRIYRNLEGRIEVQMRNGDGSWTFKGTDANNSGFISEQEIQEDLDGDGTIEANQGWNTANLITDLEATKYYYNNEWDTDGDGNIDVRARWDGTRYVFEKKKADGTWGEMGRDTNGDYIIDSNDGGVDWNLDGDKGDKVGFHEGINLWGNEVLWDDELAEMLKPLKEKGIHILLEANSCFSGGLISNLEGITENIVTGSSEDTKHTNRVKDGTIYAADQTAFMENLTGIDIDSWNAAWEKAVAADETAWKAEGANPLDKNHFQQSQLPLIDSEATFDGYAGRISFTLKIPDSFKGNVHDFEIIFGLQVPRWDTASIPGDVRSMNQNFPEGLTAEAVPGGYRIYSDEPMSQIPSLWDLGYHADTKKLRIQLTDKDHNAIGYMSPSEIDLPLAAIGGKLDARVTERPDLVVVEFEASDLSGGNAPIRRVQVFENGEEVHDSGDIIKVLYNGQYTHPISLGDTLTLELVITNDRGQKRTIRKTVVCRLGVGDNGDSGGVAPCFAANTLVLMADNSQKYISNMQVGDRVQTYNTETGQVLIADVIATNSGKADYYYLINGNLKVTPPHPFFTAEGQWVKVMDLKIGDSIRSIQGLTEITSFEKVYSKQNIFNISVRDYHNFFVSANGKDFYLVKEGL